MKHQKRKHTMTQTETTPRIFLTDYASYNNGTQFEFGHWVDLTDFSDADELNEYISNHFKEADEKSPLGSPREEIMITDYEGFPEKFYSESYDSSLIEDLFEYLETLENCHNPEAMEAYINAGYDASDFDEAFQGEYSSDEDFAETMAEELGYIQKDVQWPYTCINWEHAARELMYDYFEAGGYYFRCL